MTDDDLDRFNAELHRRSDALTEARKAVRDAEASRDPDAIAGAKETEWQARLALAVLAMGDEMRNRMMREIEHLDNQPDDPQTEHLRWLLMQRRFQYDTRSLGYPKVTDIGVADILRQLNGTEGVYSRPVDTGPGPKGFDPIDLNLIRRYVLRVFVECARTVKTQKLFLSGLSKGPTLDRFRDWSQLVPVEERKMATEIGEALGAGRPLSSDQAALWDEIKHGDLVEMYGYIARLDPKTVREVS